MVFSADSHLSFPVKSLLLAIVEGSSDLGLRCTGHISHIVGSKKMVKQEHISALPFLVCKACLM
jgi:hypothetical protein